MRWLFFSFKYYFLTKLIQEKQYWQSNRIFKWNSVSVILFFSLSLSLFFISIAWFTKIMILVWVLWLLVFQFVIIHVLILYYCDASFTILFLRVRESLYACICLLSSARRLLFVRFNLFRKKTQPLKKLVITTITIIVLSSNQRNSLVVIKQHGRCPLSKEPLF